MKEIFAAFAAEIFRPIVTILIPGLWSLSPSLVALFLRHPPIWNFVLTYRTPAAIVLLAISTALGLVLEDIGGRLEYSFFKRNGVRSEVLKRWHDYLFLDTEKKYVAFSYIRSVVLKLKFESAMCVASIPAAIGLAYIPIACTYKIWFVLGAVALGFYLGCETKGSVAELDITREALLKRINAATPRPQSLFRRLF